MPDARYERRLMDANSRLRLALQDLEKAQDLDTHLPRELREVAAAGTLVEMAKELERKTVRVARGIGEREDQRAIHTATGATRGPDRYSWADIGKAVGITAQSAHERWAKRITAH